VQLLGGPQRVRVQEKGCAAATLLIIPQRK